MADIRINSLPTTATSFNTDDYIALDGASGGTRKMLAATLPLTDVTFGSSGASAKSSIAARAARQGIQMDGTAGGTVAFPAPGTGDYTYAFWLNPTNFSATRYVLGATSGPTVAVFVNTSGQVGINNLSTNSLTGTVSLTAGKWQLVTLRRTGTNLYIGINGVEESAITDNRNYTVASGIWAGSSATTNDPWLGGISGPYVYNRALSAAEVVALYEAGVPAGADYNTATNTSQTSGTFALATGSGTVTGASATGFTASITGNSFGVVSAATARSGITVGSKFLVTFSATLTSGDTPKVYLANTATAGNTTGVTASVNVSSGSNSIVLTGSSNVSTTLYLNFQPPATGSASYAISSITITPLGLLLAPDAGQAGGGLTWYDTSGNAANITLPASGVSWNVPSSRYLGGNWTTTGNLTVSGTGSINGGSGTAAFAIKETASAGTALSLTNRNSTQTWGIAVDAAAIDDKLLAFISGGTVALSLNATNWNATFAGDVTISTAYPKIALTDTNSNSDFSLINDNGRLAVYDETNAAYRVTVGAGGGVKIGTTPEDVGANNLTVQGVLAIGNTVNTVSPTSPNRTITMVIGGTTYYLHAKTTND